MNEDWYIHGVNKLNMIWSRAGSNLRKLQDEKIHSCTCRKNLNKMLLLLKSEYRAFQHAFSDPYFFFCLQFLIYTGICIGMHSCLLE